MQLVLNNLHQECRELFFLNRVRTILVKLCEPRLELTHVETCSKMPFQQLLALFYVKVAIFVQVELKPHLVYKGLNLLRGLFLEKYLLDTVVFQITSWGADRLLHFYDVRLFNQLERQSGHLSQLEGSSL